VGKGAAQARRAMSVPEPSQRRIEVALFLIPFLTFAYFYQGSDQSTAARFDLMRAIVERHTLSVDGYSVFNSADIIQLNGHYYSAKAPGAAFMGLAQWLIVTRALKPLMAHDGALYWALATYLTIIFSTGLIVSLMCVFAWRFARFFGVQAGRAAVIALVLAFGTIVFPYATEMTGEPIAAACAFISFYLLATQVMVPEPGRAMVAGALAGCAVLCDFPAILIAAVLAGYAFVRLADRREFIAFAAGAGAIAVLMLAYNKAAFGNPLFFSYEAYKLPGNSQFPEQAKGFVGLTYPRPDILWNTLFDAQRGLLYCNPVMVLVLPALGFFRYRRAFRAEFFVVLLAIVSMILFNASYGESIVSWGGGTATGPRQIVAAIPVMVLALAFIPAEWDWIFGALAVASVFAMLMATAVEPHFPYEYSNPLIDFIWPAYFRGDLAYNRDAYFGGPAIVAESTAFNLGKLAGLPRALQLFPLAALWIAGGIYLLRVIDKSSIRVLDVLPENIGDFRFASFAVVVVTLAMVAPPVVGSLATSLTSPLTPEDASAVSQGLLGHYYRGTAPGRFPPHIVRVDAALDFQSVAELGALPPPSCVIWTGTIVAPSAGLYHFVIDADDTGWLLIDGKTVIPDPGNVMWFHSHGDVYLTAGSHKIDAGERNLEGDAIMKLSWQLPGQPLETVPSSNLLPAESHGK
jgi:hypothetical protein